MLDVEAPGVLFDTAGPGDELADPVVGRLDETTPDDDWLTTVAMPLEDPETPPTGELETPGLLDDGIPPGVEDAPPVFVYWSGGETTGTEPERLELITEDMLTEELSPP